MPGYRTGALFLFAGELSHPLDGFVHLGSHLLELVIWPVVGRCVVEFSN